MQKHIKKSLLFLLVGLSYSMTPVSAAGVVVDPTKIEILKGFDDNKVIKKVGDKIIAELGSQAATFATKNADGSDTLVNQVAQKTLIALRKRYAAALATVAVIDRKLSGTDQYAITGTRFQYPYELDVTKMKDTLYPIARKLDLKIKLENISAADYPTVARQVLADFRYDPMIKKGDPDAVSTINGTGGAAITDTFKTPRSVIFADSGFSKRPGGNTIANVDETLRKGIPMILAGLQAFDVDAVAITLADRNNAPLNVDVNGTVINLVLGAQPYDANDVAANIGQLRVIINNFIKDSHEFLEFITTLKTLKAMKDDQLSPEMKQKLVDLIAVNDSPFDGNISASMSNQEVSTLAATHATHTAQQTNNLQSALSAMGVSQQGLADASHTYGYSKIYEEAAKRTYDEAREKKAIASLGAAFRAAKVIKTETAAKHAYDTVKAEVEAHKATVTTQQAAIVAKDTKIAETSTQLATTTTALATATTAAAVLQTNNTAAMATIASQAATATAKATADKVAKLNADIKTQQGGLKKAKTPAAKIKIEEAVRKLKVQIFQAQNPGKAIPAALQPKKAAKKKK